MAKKTPRAILCLFLPYFLILSCSQEITENPLELALATDDIRIRRVVENLAEYQIQIKYTQINRYKDSILFTDYDFQVNPDHYFYPASTVKLPVAVVALEKLNELDSIDRNTRFYIEGDTTETTFAKTIQELFVISDNEANNRLIEFLGFNDLNERIQKRGLAPIQISHRLATKDADDITTKPLVIYNNDSTLSISKPIINKNPEILALEGIKKGKGFYVDDSLHQGPFNFSLKNFYPLPAQHKLLKQIIFPNSFTKKQSFNLSKDQHRFLLDAMSTLPGAAGYNTKTYYDSYVKFFMYGDTKEPIPEYIKIYNKVGHAYGTLTDCAYIKDTKNNIDFMVSATILVNKNGVFNDDNYEYDEIGIPFLAQLGRELYAIELKRNR